MSTGLPLTCSTDELYATTLNILERLVGFDTTSRNSNLELIEYVRSLLSGNGITSSLHWNERRDKANLVATARPPGSAGRGVIWSGHTDVVPVDGQEWTTDPFTLRLTGAHAVGRGSADMKGFIACCLAIMSTVRPESLAVPITLLLTYDEEVGCVGIRDLLPELRTWANGAVGCLVGEPTGMRVVIGHKGKQNHRIRLTGEPKHAALAPEMANPVVAAAELVGFAERLNERFRTVGPHDQRFAINHSWINVGRIDGGVKPNIVPDHCVVELEVRAIPGHSCDDIAAELGGYATAEVLPRMRKRTGSADISLERLSDTPAFLIDQEHDFVNLVRTTFEQTDQPEHVPFGTEAGLIWGHAGVPAVVCGPGSISEAHTPHESVPLEDLRTCLARLRSLG